MIDKSFIEKIESMSEVKIIDIGARPFSTKQIFPVMDPQAEPLSIHTLTGIISFLSTLPTEVEKIIQVRDYDEVVLVSNLFGSNKQRETFIVADAHKVSHRFGGFMPVDEFIVYLQSCFVQDGTTADILSVVGNITQGVEARFEDDGITQRVEAKAGITKREVVPVPNPVTIRPFRTFPDIEQPASKFILRMKAGGNESPRCALFEADGGGWKNTAIASIKEFLQNGTERQIQVVA